jgi:putative transposase
MNKAAPEAMCRHNAAPIARLPEMRSVEHLRVRYALRCNNRVEQAHQPTRVRERVMRGFRSLASAQRFLDAFSRVGDLFRPGCHRGSRAVVQDAQHEF